MKYCNLQNQTIIYIKNLTIFHKTHNKIVTHYNFTQTIINQQNFQVRDVIG